jgi:hypothetical protein
MFTLEYFYLRTRTTSNVTLKKIQARRRKIRRILKWTKRNIMDS